MPSARRRGMVRMTHAAHRVCRGAQNGPESGVLSRAEIVLILPASVSRAL